MRIFFMTLMAIALGMNPLGMASSTTSGVNQCMATTCAPSFSGVTVTNAGTHPNFNTSSITLQTTPAAGDWENDGNNPYFTPFGTSRGAVPAEQVMMLTSARTMPSSSPAPIFNIGSSSTGGATLNSATTYQFDMNLYISSMSSTTGTASLTFATTGAIGSIFYTVIGSHSTAANAVSATNFIGNVQQATVTAVTTSTTTTTCVLYVHGLIRMTTTGTVTPEISFSQTSTPVIAANSFFKIYPEGTSTTNTIGNVV